MKEVFLYLLMFFAFGIFANEQNNKEKNTNDVATSQVVSLQTTVQGYLAENIPTISEPTIRGIVSSFNNNLQYIENLRSIQVFKIQLNQIGILAFRPPILTPFKIKLYDSGTDDGAHPSIA